MPVSEAKQKANRKYDKKTYSRISLVIKKTHKPLIMKYATKKGISQNSFIKNAIMSYIKSEFGDSVEI